MNELKDTAKTSGNYMTFFGILTIIAGILAMLAPGLTGLSIAMLVGVLVVIGGIVRMIWAFKANRLGKGLLVFAIGALTLVCGVLLVANPLFAAGFLTLLLAIYFVVDGLCEVIAGFRQRPEAGWGFMIFGGIISILLGSMMWSQYPLAGVWAIGVLVGIKLFFIGMIMITGGSVVRTAADVETT